jgi:hypothetical protein
MSIDIYGNEVDERSDWEKEWEDMPLFRDPNNKKEEEYCTVIVRFVTEADFKDFCKAINQDITILKAKTKSIWHPKKTIEIVRFFE